METDYSLIKKIKKDNCSDSFVELTNRHCKLFYSICNKYVSPAKHNEIHLDMNFVFLKSLNSYKKNKKTKFSTWLGNCTRYYCLNYTKAESKYIDAEDDETTRLLFTTKSIENYHNEELKYDIDHIFSILDEQQDKRIPKIFRMRYLHITKKRPTWKTIGESFNLTSQTIINLHSKGRTIIKKSLKDKNSFD